MTNLRTESELAILLLGICPAAAACTRLIDALWISAGALFVLAVTGCLTTLARPRTAVRPRAVIRPRTSGVGPRTVAAGSVPLAAAGSDLSAGPGVRDLRDWGVLLVSSCCAGIFELVLFALAPAAAARLGVSIPLLAVTAPSMGRMIGDKGERSMRAALGDVAARGTLFTAVLVIVTAVREVLGSGTLTLGRTIAVRPFFDDPARALGLAGGALICLGYVAGAARLRRTSPRAAVAEGGRE